MLDDVLPVIERPKESRQFMAVALANPWVAQDERMATKFMERNLLVGEQLVPVARHLFSGQPTSVGVLGEICKPHVFGELPKGGTPRHDLG